MKLALLLVLLPALATVSAQFAPSVTAVDCSSGPVYTFTLTGQTDTGVIFVNGKCGAKDTAVAQSTYTFVAGDCAGGIPALGETFKVVVQQYAILNLQTDLVVQVTCNLDYSNINVDTSASTQGSDAADDTKTTIKKPTITALLTDASNNALSSGNVGTDVKLVISMSLAENNVFGFQVFGLNVETATPAYTVAMVTAGCAAYTSIIPQPPAIATDAVNAKIIIPFKLFIPKDAKSDYNLPGVGSASTVTFKASIKVCDLACTNPTCGAGRKKRSLTANNSTYDPIEIATTLLVYPPGYKIPSSSGATNDALLDDVCISRTPIIGVLVALSVALVVCLALTAVMFCKLRKPARKGDMSPYENGGYKA